MTVAERMRARGWSPFVAGMWHQYVAGVQVVVAAQERPRYGMDAEPGFFVFAYGTRGEVTTSGLFHGLVSVAQRAKAAAKAFARKEARQ